MSKNNNCKTLGAVIGDRSTDQILPDEAMIFALASDDDKLDRGGCHSHEAGIRGAI